MKHGKGIKARAREREKEREKERKESGVFGERSQRIGPRFLPDENELATRGQEKRKRDKKRSRILIR